MAGFSNTSSGTKTRHLGDQWTRHLQGEGQPTDGLGAATGILVGVLVSLLLWALAYALLFAG